LTKALSGLGYTAYSIIFAIAIILMVSFITMLHVRGKYRWLQKDLKSAEVRRDNRFKSQVLNDIVEDYRNISMTARGEINTQAIVEKNFSMRLKGLALGERFVKNSVSLMVVLGLLGTFYGLTISVGKLVELLNTSGNSDMLVGMDSIITGLISAVKGMAVAFSTSLAGVSGSVVITILGILINIEESRQTLMIQLEDYLDNVVEQELLQNKESELSRISAAIISCFDGFSLKVENVLHSTVLDFSDKLSTASSNIVKSSEGLEGTINKFQEALAVFSNNTRDFSEFNYNLRGNIERMDVSFLNLKESLAETAGIIASNQKSMNDITDAIQQAATVISSEKGNGDRR
jgi:methyl-accepting chemotaxis protein